MQVPAGGEEAGCPGPPLPPLPVTPPPLLPPSFQCPLPVSEQPDSEPVSLSQEHFRPLDGLPTCLRETGGITNELTLSLFMLSH